MNNLVPILKYDVYNGRMAASLLDKLFFADKIDANLVVDFGCADGTLIRYMLDWMGEKTQFWGFDNDAAMVKAAWQRFTHKEAIGDAISRIHFEHNWAKLQQDIAVLKRDGVVRRTAIVLSSVIHEVYNYSDRAAVDAFWADVLGGGFDFIVIRDMIPNQSIDRNSDVGDVAKVLRKFRATRELKDFESHWGSIQSNKNLVHFLLKYKYVTPNWTREVKENYLPLYWEDLMAVPWDGYDVAYHEHYALPYIKRSVREDFGIELKDPTHLKLILEKRS